ncbi:hypothetical protein TWF696_002259 [Orbilia brochopaga]|uniref:Uncharacterized protein n=1 Tax=Orbilia brochopaga TaxID=3140254 RepID=A0AAV9U822_9PEZI
MAAENDHQLERIDEIDADADNDFRALEARALEAMNAVYQLQMEADEHEKQAKESTIVGTSITALQSSKRKKGKRVPGRYNSSSDQESDESESYQYGSGGSEFEPSDRDGCSSDGNSDSETDDNPSDRSDGSPSNHSDAADDTLVDSPSNTANKKYRISKFRLKPRAETESLGRSDLLDRFSELQKFVNGNKTKITKRQLRDCIIRLEDYLYEAKKESGADISPQEQIDAEDGALVHSRHVPWEMVGMLKNDKPKESNRFSFYKPGNGKEGMLGNIYNRLFHPKITDSQNSSSSTIVQRPQTFTLPSDDTRNFKLKKWTQEDYQRETTGRLPFIDPEVKQALEAIRRTTHQEVEKNRKYATGTEYNPDDLALITISTLPSNGPKKVTHTGPQTPEYYRNYATRLFASVETWVRKYLVPEDMAPIDIRAPDVSQSLRSAIGSLPYFHQRDFLPPPTANLKGEELKLRTESCRAKRQIYFQYMIYSILNEEIWCKWLYGLDDRVDDKVLELAKLDRSQKNTVPGHAARGKWYHENIRTQPTNTNINTVNHSVQLATTFRQMFVPLLRFKDTKRTASDRRMPTSAERELHMIISDAQALQYMFQSERGGVHIVQFDEPSTPFEAQWMVNAANREDMRRLKESAVPGRPGELTERDQIALAYRPALFIGTETLIWEKIVAV